MQSDQELIHLVLSGKRAAVSDFIDRYRNLVRRVVFRLVNDSRDREEVAQDTFLKAIRSLRSFRSESKLSTWVARIAYRESIQHLRRTTPAPEEVPIENDRFAADPAKYSAEKTLRLRELEAFVAGAVDLLTPTQKTVVTLYYLEEMEVSEVAQVVGIPVNTVKSHLLRSRRALREQLIEEAREHGYTT